MQIDVYGDIVPNESAWIYEWLDMDCTCPKYVQGKIDGAGTGESLEVYINSPGGEISAGSAIYTMLKSYTKGDVNIHIIGMAHSAASVIAMAGWSEMSPTALMMVHCVSSAVAGNHNDMEKAAEVLRTADEALSSAYSIKSGMSREQAIEMMEKETWLRADEAVKLGLVDKVMFGEEAQMASMAAYGGATFKNMENIARKMNSCIVTSQEGAVVKADMLRNGEIFTKTPMPGIQISEEASGNKSEYAEGVDALGERIRLARAKLELIAGIGGRK